MQPSELHKVEPSTLLRFARATKRLVAMGMCIGPNFLTASALSGSSPRRQVTSSRQTFSCQLHYSGFCMHTSNIMATFWQQAGIPLQGCQMQEELIRNLSNCAIFSDLAFGLFSARTTDTNVLDNEVLTLTWKSRTQNLSQMTNQDDHSLQLLQIKLQELKHV